MKKKIFQEIVRDPTANYDFMSADVRDKDIMDTTIQLFFSRERVDESRVYWFS